LTPTTGFFEKTSEIKTDHKIFFEELEFFKLFLLKIFEEFILKK
jgi:hypothetical protein